MRADKTLSCILALGLGLGPGHAIANNEVITKQADSKQWVTQLGNYAGHRYSKLAQINKSNVSRLRPAWNFSTGALRGHAGGPLVIGDILYLHTPFPNKVFALDLTRGGKILWQFSPKQHPDVAQAMPTDTINHGLAYANDKIFVCLANTTLIALEAKTGRVVWRATNGDAKLGETATSAPLVVKDKVIVGVAGSDYGVRGHLTAYNVDSGMREWRAYTTGPDADILFSPQETHFLGQPVGADSSINSWQNGAWKRGGGSTSGWITYDAELNLIYYGTGAPAPMNAIQRPGDNRWTASILARDVDSGKAKWVYQFTPHDQWHYSSTGEMMLVDLPLQNQPRKALVHFDRNGFAYVLDRSTGELINAKKYDANVNWAEKIDLATGRPIEVARFSPANQGENVTTTHICPASLGGKSKQPAAFSPKRKRFFVPMSTLCMDYEPHKVALSPNTPYRGASISMYPDPKDSAASSGRLIAWDAVQGKVLWSKMEKFAVWSGVLATAGDIVFYGTLDGHLKAVSQETGKELWSYKTASGIVGNVNTFNYRGRQYISVLSGIGDWPGMELAAELSDKKEALGAVGAFAELKHHTQLGGVLTVFDIPPVHKK